MIQILILVFAFSTFAETGKQDCSALVTNETDIWPEIVSTHPVTEPYRAYLSKKFENWQRVWKENLDGLLYIGKATTFDLDLTLEIWKDYFQLVIIPRPHSALYPNQSHSGFNYLSKLISDAQAQYNDILFRNNGKFYQPLLGEGSGSSWGKDGQWTQLLPFAFDRADITYLDLLLTAFTPRARLEKVVD